jgi:3',5'-cyclic AMP phosphodiesterase CpdA
LNLRIGQLTDLHIGFDRTNEREGNLIRLEATLARLTEPGVRPDVLLLTGDLTEHGDDASFARLAAALVDYPIPVWPIPGNHDTRDGLLRAFAQVTATDGFVQYAIDLPGLRVLMLDTLELGRHGGAFCDVRARWLSDRLSEAPVTPTLIAMHHPPFPTGVVWMDTRADEAWVARFAETIAGHAQIVAITSGHVHRAATTLWHGIPAQVCPSSAPAVALNLSPIDPDVPDGRPMITDEPPGLALHCWDGTALITHLFSAEHAQPLASHNGAMTPLLRSLFAERPDAG